MAKKLQLQFYNEDNKTVTISLDDPVEPADAAAVSQAMDDIIAQNALFSSGGDLVAKKAARIVDRNVQEIPLT
jgi:aromatic ring-opening dioxygenase catalytic subunit (LigB family)